MARKPSYKNAAEKAKENLAVRSVRRPRTLSLDDKTYQALRHYCAGKDLTVSDVIDELMKEFLAQITGEGG